VATSSAAAVRGLTSPELGSRAREDTGNDANEREAHPQRDGEFGGVAESLAAGNLSSSLSAAGGDELEASVVLCGVGLQSMGGFGEEDVEASSGHGGGAPGARWPRKLRTAAR
jgi:hypothetical protein